jgi:glycosyltransferase involved in cell wall biosynthesis
MELTSIVQTVEVMMGKRTCILLKSLPTGGVEKMMLNLADGLAHRGHTVDIVLFEWNGAFAHSVPESVTIRTLTGGGEYRLGKKLLTVGRMFRRYVREHRPDVVISAKEQANLINVIFRLVYRNRYRSVITRHTSLDGDLVGTNAKPSVRWLYRKMLWRADRIVAVSEGIADEIRSLVPVTESRKVSVICNPVIDDSMYEKSGQPIDDPWFRDRREPVIVVSGRLSIEKGFDILLNAVSILKNRRPVKLLILGEGELREKLKEDIDRLSLDNDVRLAGFKANPYPYYRNADVFVLSSRWEGQPLALIEALALGTRIVSTDCWTGPSEILQGGRLGVLVPTEDPAALAEGIETALKNTTSERPNQNNDLDKYSISAASSEYDELFCSLVRDLK